FSVWGLWAGIGIATLWRQAAEELRTTLRRASPVLALAAVPLVFNWGWASRAGDYSARDWAYNLLMSVEPYAILFTNGDNDTFPLWYLQEVEGIRRDVTVIVTSYLNTEWYAKQLKGLTTPCEEGVEPDPDWTLIRCQRPYRYDNTGAAYVSDPAEAEAAGKVPLLLDEPVREPTRPILPLTDEQIESVALSYAPIEQDLQLRMGDVVTVLRAGDLLSPWEQFALNLIDNSIDERPIYFASSGNAASSLGLQDYLVREGLAFRLNPGPLEEVDGSDIRRMVESPYTPVIGRWVDVERTRTLLDSVYVHRGGLPDEWPHWPDASTLGIPSYYAWTYLAMAQAAIQDEDQEALQRYQERAEVWSALGL
ncbi:MAG TPA: hypothetical protein VFQ22_04085, partial [Longimicrobiales bacterium]|nr:hypothetical protein [Longimicrobiales bacterium]